MHYSDLITKLALCNQDNLTSSLMINADQGSIPKIAAPLRHPADDVTGITTQIAVINS
ncbi:hypothetical protein [Lonsdalea iberica]|uniref:hypothetical protein n=1 Tax=Lonsdalea iberica TaxID=1082703 RepID=UPI00159378C3|nr:hypothetical protein [Lonsdalea iberica]